MRTRLAAGLVAAVLGCGAPAPTPCENGDYKPTEADFDCTLSWPQVGQLRVINRCNAQSQAESVANSNDSGRRFPVGTIVQLMPGEAMVKRGPGFDTANHDWEYFVLGGSPAGTRIKQRGTTEVSNDVGKCLDCHAGGKEFDYICQDGHGCDRLPLPRSVIASQQYTDLRCP